MKNKTNKQGPQKSRRTFLQSMGMSVAGLSVLPTSIFAGVKNSRQGIETLELNPYSAGNLKSDVILPNGVSAVWDISKAYHETTPTRERICINGLWQWQPGTVESDQVPTTNWGYFKVPGNWPGLNNYMQRENQRLFAHPEWSANSVEDIKIAWYRREISIPENWKNRRVTLNADYVNSSALVFIDGVKAGEILFPGGELDLTSICLPGSKHIMSIKVTALPLQDVVAVFNDSNAPRQGKGVVARRGLCGDVYLTSTPLKARVNNVSVVTSVRKGEITLNTLMENLTTNSKYTLKVVIKENGNIIKEFNSKVFTSNQTNDGLISVTESWKPDKLWDVHTPQNMFEITVSLVEGGKLVLDTTIPSRFGFREFWIEGRDFYLNGTRIFLSTVPFDNAQSGAALASYEGAKESMIRLMSFGINFVYTHNYGCEPGTHISFEEVLRAADDTGMLISLSQPHSGQYDWTAPNADQNNGYAHHAKFYTQVAHNHPSVVFYSMNHNATGYTEDMNPEKIDGLSRPESSWSSNNVKKALRAEVIVAGLDPSRIIYHHSSGNLSPMHTSNFYPNWVPIQEMNDWFGHWATVGVKPVLLCEFGAPFTWDWAMYRGWYKGKREFGSAQVPWEFCLAEWNSQFLGDKAFNISEFEKINLRWEAERFKAGAVWGRSSYPYNFDNRILEERNPVFSMHIADNWRAFRTWGVSANSPWHHGPYWKMRDGVKEVRKDYVIDWENLQRPGLSPDFINDRASRMDLDIGFDRSDWMPTVAESLIRNNMGLLAYIAGKPSAFTSKDHNFLPGTKFMKQLIVINNSRLDVSCECNWSLNLPEAVSGNKTISLATGQQERIPLNFTIPASLSPGNYEIKASVKFSNGETQNDIFTIQVLPSVKTGDNISKTALFDPKGETGRLLDSLGLKYQSIEAGADLSGFEVLIVGKEALTADGKGLDAGSVRNGLKIIMFEQSAEVLEKRFGFRVQEYSLRKVYKRLSDHQALAGLNMENLCDWQGDATLLPLELKAEMHNNVFSGVPTIKWCDIPVTRIWRCGNRGSVASVLIEKPASGNFLPIIDGGFSLQYSPLIEYREGQGMVMFCQMDVTGRTEPDPAAERLTRNILSYVSGWKPAKNRQVVYAGEAAGLSHLEKIGVSALKYEKKKLLPDQVLIVGPGGKQILSSTAKAINKWITAGGHVLAIGLEQADVSAIFPFKLTMKKEEHIASYFETPGTSSFFAGIGPSDVHNRAPIEVSLVSAGAGIIGNGVLAKADNANVVFCQLVPWQLDFSKEQHNVKQTFRRSSFMLNRLLGNLGVGGSTRILERFKTPVDEAKAEKRWLDGLYVDIPEEWDDPYRFFRW